MTPGEQSLLVLGAGYTGTACVDMARERGYVVTATWRTQDVARTGLPEEGRLRFSLGDRGTWDELPECPWGVLTFPVEPLPLVQEFAALLMKRVRRVVALGTTSSYLQSSQDQLLDEDATLDYSSPRVQGEEFLRLQGAIVLRSAGIYGPAVGGLQPRNPLDWLRSGSITDGAKFVNLVHVSDLAAAILAALESTAMGQQYIVSDGIPRRWKEIADWAGARGFLREYTFSGRAGRPSRQLSNQRLLTELKPSFRHTDLFREIEALESVRPHLRNDTSPAP